MTVNVGDWVKLKPVAIEKLYSDFNYDDLRHIKRYFRQKHKVIEVDRWDTAYDDEDPEPADLVFKFPITIERGDTWVVQEDKVTVVRRSKCNCTWAGCRNHARRSKAKPKKKKVTSIGLTSRIVRNYWR